MRLSLRPLTAARFGVQNRPERCVCAFRCIASPAGQAHAGSESHHDTPKHGWVQSQLDELLHGVSHATKRAQITTKGVSHVERALLRKGEACATGKQRMTGLDLCLNWEAKLPTGQPLQGVAKVLLDAHADRVEVRDIQLLGADGAAPPRDVVIAVESMDSVIMDRLNQFMWKVENASDVPANSFDADDADEEDMTAHNSHSVDDNALLPGQGQFPDDAPVDRWQDAHGTR